MAATTTIRNHVIALTLSVAKKKNMHSFRGGNGVGNGGTHIMIHVYSYCRLDCSITEIHHYKDFH